jgi:hypothetical protein
MPERETIKRARQDAREGKRPSTQAGEFVREEIHHIREGKHGAASAKQAIAIGLSKARRAGVRLPPPPGKRGARSTSRRRRSGTTRKPSTRRANAALKKLKRKGRAAASHRALSRQAKAAAKRRRRTAKARA